MDKVARGDGGKHRCGPGEVRGQTGDEMQVLRSDETDPVDVHRPPELQGAEADAVLAAAVRETQSNPLRWRRVREKGRGPLPGAQHPTGKPETHDERESGQSSRSNRTATEEPEACPSGGHS